MDEAAQHIGYILGRCFDENIRTIEPSKRAEDEWVEEIIKLSRFNEEFLEACTPGYYNNEGKPNPISRQNAAYGKGPIPFFRMMEAWREDGAMEGLQIAGGAQVTRST